MLIRLFVPESDKRTKEKEAGRASHWSERDCSACLVGCGAACGIIALWAIPQEKLDLGFAWSGRWSGWCLWYWLSVSGEGYLARSGTSRGTALPHARSNATQRGLSGVPLLGTWAGLMWMYQWVGKLPGGDVPDARPLMQIGSSIARRDWLSGRALIVSAAAGPATGLRGVVRPGRWRRWWRFTASTTVYGTVFLLRCKLALA